MQPIATERRDDIVYKQLIDNIKSGAWKSGDKLPTEAELCGIFNVSRSTIRAAIQRLRSIGLVETVHGKVPTSATTTSCSIIPASLIR